LKAGGQIILFLNVRGYSPVFWCRNCGAGVKCPDCDVTLTWHKTRGVALCHSCDYSTEPPSACPKCGKPGLLSLGIGTERLESEVRTRFPEYKCLRMDSDTMQQRGSHDTALEAFRHGDVRILLGTQMIAKGLDFPNVTLVGVIDADTLLHQPDMRSAERTFQLIAQVAGRTGRSAKGGRVLVQTASPDQPAILKASSHDYAGFANEELKHRQALKVPPFTHLARVILRGPRESELKAYSEKCGQILKSAAQELGLEIRILGPAPCLVTRLKANFRYHLQLTSADLSALQQLWLNTASRLASHPEIEYVVDVDPLNLR
jgi:primosomal protein N' (replication factor Y) (superfamily II helicase)